MVEAFDVFSYLDDRSIPYATQGKNTTPGWVNIKCPMDHCADPSNHLGINISTKLFHCWRCGTKGSTEYLITLLEGCSFYQAKKVINEFQDLTFSHLRQDIKERYLTNENILPKGVEPLNDQQRDYLRSRGFNPEQLIRLYGLQSAGITGDYKYRIIAPVLLKGRVVNFTAMAPMKGVDPKYKHCPNEKALYPMKELVYNIDSVTDTVLVLEGITDVWKMGPGAVALMGMEWTTKQVLILAETGVKKAVTMFDGEPLAIKRAKELARTLSSLIPKVETIELSKGDPGDFDEKMVGYVRKEVFGF